MLNEKMTENSNYFSNNSHQQQVPSMNGGVPLNDEAMQYQELQQQEIGDMGLD